MSEKGFSNFLNQETQAAQERQSAKHALHNKTFFARQDIYKKIFNLSHTNLPAATDLLVALLTEEFLHTAMHGSYAYSLIFERTNKNFRDGVVSKLEEAGFRTTFDCLEHESDLGFFPKLREDCMNSCPIKVIFWWDQAK